MSDKFVYIPTRGRPDNVLKTLPRWLGQGYAVRYVIEPQEYRAYQHMVERVWRGSSWDQHPNLYKPQLHLLPDANRGIGYARDFCLTWALNEGCKTVVISDDDVMPKAEILIGGRDDFGRLHKAVEELGLFACSAVHSYQDFLTQGWLKKDRDTRNSPQCNKDGVEDCECELVYGRPFFVTSGSFHTCYAIDVQTAIGLGGFKWELNVAYEDNDLHIRAIKDGRIWAAHSGVWMDYIGKRFAPGGLADYAGIDDGEGIDREGAGASTFYEKEFLRCRALLWNEHKPYVSQPPKRMMFKWKQIHDDFFGDWKKMSAQHGGNLPDVEGL